MKFYPLYLLLSVMALCVPCASAQTETAARPPGRIVAARVRGEIYATVKATQVRTQLSDGSEIAQGSTVTTGAGGSVVLIFSNGATVNLGDDAVLDIEEFTQDPFGTPFNAADAKEEPTSSTTRLHMQRGELVGHVAKLNQSKGSTFNIGTPVGAAGIRGTTFRIIYRADSTGKATFSLTTLEGSVEVTLATGTVTSAPVEVGTSKEIEITAEITTDASGNVTVTLPSGASTIIPSTASATTLQQVTDVAQQIAQAVANIVITSTPASTSESKTEATTTEETKTTETEKKTSTEDAKTTTPETKSSTPETKSTTQPAPPTRQPIDTSVNSPST